MRISVRSVHFLALFVLLCSGFVSAAQVEWKKGDYNLSIFEKAPQVQSVDGEFDKLELTFTTRIPVPAARVSLRAVPEDRRVRFSMARESFKERLIPGESAWKEHRITLNIARMAKYLNRHHLGENGDDIIYTVELYDPEMQAASYYESVFRIKPSGSGFVRLPAVTEGPFVDCVTDRSAMVSFKTDMPVAASLSLGGKTFSSGKTSDSHEIPITGLKSRELYPYTVHIDGGGRSYSLPMFAFRTAPALGSDDKFRFVYMADCRVGSGVGHENFGPLNRKALENALIDANRYGAEFVLFGGDLVRGYTSSKDFMQQQYHQFKRITSMVGHFLPIYECMGNHEVYGDMYTAEVDGKNHSLVVNRPGADSSSELFASQFVNPADSYPEPDGFKGKKGPSYRETVYSFDYGNSHFVVLNTDYWYTLVRPFRSDLANDALIRFGGARDGYLLENQMKWLDRDLEAARKRGRKHIFMVFHENVFPNASHVGDGMYWGEKKDGKWVGLNDKDLPMGDVADMRNRFLEIVGRHRVLAMFCAHEHGYNRLLIDGELGNVSNSLWQITSAGVGAPYALQVMDLPWSGRLTHNLDHNITVIDVDGDKVTFKAITSQGDILDEMDNMYDRLNHSK